MVDNVLEIVYESTPDEQALPPSGWFLPTKLSECDRTVCSEETKLSY